MSEMEQILETEVYDGDTLRTVLKDLVVKIFNEQEGFSGKRPFGDSDFYCRVENSLVIAGFVEGVVEDGEVVQSNDAQFDKLIKDCVEYAFGT